MDFELLCDGTVERKCLAFVKLKKKKNSINNAVFFLRESHDILGNI
jgi:hypothetical protein